MLLRGMAGGLSMGRGMGYGAAAFQQQVFGRVLTPQPPPGAPPAAPPIGAPPAAPPDIPPAPVPPPVLDASGGSLPATGPAVPVGGAVSSGIGVALTIGGTTPAVYTGVTKGPNELALDAAMAAAGVTTDDQAQAWLSSLDGQPAPQFLNETSSAYYLAILDKKQKEATYLKWGIGAAAAAALVLLLK